MSDFLPPERAAAVEYLRRKGTEASAAKLHAGLKSTFQRFEQAIARVPAPLHRRRPSASAWSVHEIVDHLVETHGRALAELRELAGGVAPRGGPVPAHLTSADPFSRSFEVLSATLTSIHRDVLATVAGGSDAVSALAVRAPFVMVVKVGDSAGVRTLEWIEPLDWKAYAQALRVHTYEHLAQVERTVAALLASGEEAP